MHINYARLPLIKIVTTWYTPVLIVVYGVLFFFFPQELSVRDIVLIAVYSGFWPNWHDIQLGLPGWHTVLATWPGKVFFPHDNERMHDKERQKRTAKVSARQRGNTAHDKQKVHDKANEMRKAKNPCTAKKKRHCRDHTFAVCKVRAHGKVAFAVCFYLCRAPCGIFFFFLSIVLILIFIFIL